MFAASKKRVTVVIAILGAIALSTAAYAYWTSGGSGTGSASTEGAQQSLTVNLDQPVVDLYPGGPSQGIFVSFDNPNKSAIFVGAVKVEIDRVTKGGVPAVGCDTSNYRFEAGEDTIALPSNTQIPGLSTDSGSFGAGARIEMVNKPTTNQDACKGATVELDFTVL